jgi:hypothetical protein
MYVTAVQFIRSRRRSEHHHEPKGCARKINRARCVCMCLFAFHEAMIISRVCCGSLASWRTRKRWLPTRRNGRGGERHVGTNFVGDDDVMISVIDAQKLEPAQDVAPGPELKRSANHREVRRSKK